jgi:hypothetical protein
MGLRMSYRTTGILVAVLCTLSLVTPLCCAAQLNAATSRAFDDYVSASETRLQIELNDPHKFLVTDSMPETERQNAYVDLKQGEVVIANHLADKDASAPAGLIHDWTGVIFIPGATISSTFAILQDYDRDSAYYRPDVVKSKLLARAGDDFRVFLRLRRTYVVTAVFDTEYDVRYTLVNPTHAYSKSVSIRIAEIDNAGEPQEREKPLGEDRGLLWRLNSYWRFYEADGGVYVQCEAISLTRDIPVGLGWMVKPFVEKVPRESLRFTLTATRDAVLKRK